MCREKEKRVIFQPGSRDTAALTYVYRFRPAAENPLCGKNLTLTSGRVNGNFKFRRINVYVQCGASRLTVWALFLIILRLEWMRDIDRQINRNPVERDI